MEEKTVKAENRDSLTGLINRSQFEHELKSLYISSSFDKQQHTFCYIDLDLFKVVNDLYGHDAGDSLICAISKIIKNHIHYNDTLARLGGDEFGLIIKHCNLERSEQIANLIRECIRSFRLKIENDVFGVSVSIGIVLINSETKNISDLMKQADIACFAAKRAGRDRIQIYRNDDKQITLEHDDMIWFNRINNALDNNQFCLFFQPIIALMSTELSKLPPACEILLRMKNENGEVILPGEFLPPAIRYGLASRIDRWVICSVFDYLDNHIEFIDKYSIITINLSGQSLGNKELLDFLSSRLASIKYPKNTLCFEITETEAIENIAMAIEFITTLKDKFGCLFALDDFGSGFSSFQYIRELPVDIVKIDGSFVKDMDKDPFSKILVKALNDISQVCNKITVAEWVENKNTLDEIQALGVNYAQGNYLAKPVSIKEIMY